MAEAVAAAGFLALASVFDVSDRGSVEAGMAAAAAALGPIDILVNNAGKGGQHGIGQAQSGRAAQNSGRVHWRSTSEGPCIARGP